MKNYSVSRYEVQTLRATVRQQAKEIAELRAVVDKLPKIMVNGEVLSYGDKVYWFEDQVQWAYFRCVRPSGHVEVQHLSGAMSWPHKDDVYSTQAAAEAAKEE